MQQWVVVRVNIRVVMEMQILKYSGSVLIDDPTLKPFNSFFSFCAFLVRTPFQNLRRDVAKTSMMFDEAT